MSDSLGSRLENLTQDTSAEARKFHEAGGKVVGYLSNNIPIEIISAAGMWPYHLEGDSTATTELADEYMEPAFDRVTRSIFNKILTGYYNFLDLIVLPRTNDAQQRLYYYLCEIKRKCPQYKIPPVYLLDLLHSPGEINRVRNQTQFKMFADFLKVYSGGNASFDESLETSVGQYNQIREKLRIFNQFRADKKFSVTSVLAHQVYAAARTLSPALLIDVLDKVIEAFNEEASKKHSAQENSVQAKKIKIMLAGNGLDHPQLHQLIDELGATISADYHSLGNQFLVSAVEESNDLIASLADHYTQETISGRSFIADHSPLVEFAQSQNAQAAVFFYLEKEEALNWLYPKQKNALVLAGIPTVMFADQHYQLDVEQLRPALKKMIDEI